VYTDFWWESLREIDDLEGLGMHRRRVVRKILNTWDDGRGTV
jgi:hypothetical protein